MPQCSTAALQKHQSFQQSVGHPCVPRAVSTVVHFWINVREKCTKVFIVNDRNRQTALDNKVQDQRTRQRLLAWVVWTMTLSSDSEIAGETLSCRCSMALDTLQVVLVHQGKYWTLKATAKDSEFVLVDIWRPRTKVKDNNTVKLSCKFWWPAEGSSNHNSGKSQMWTNSNQTRQKESMQQNKLSHNFRHLSRVYSAFRRWSCNDTKCPLQSVYCWTCYCASDIKILGRKWKSIGISAHAHSKTAVNVTVVVTRLALSSSGTGNSWIFCKNITRGIERFLCDSMAFLFYLDVRFA